MWMCGRNAIAALLLLPCQADTITVIFPTLGTQIYTFECIRVGGILGPIVSKWQKESELILEQKLCRLDLC